MLWSIPLILPSLLIALAGRLAKVRGHGRVWSHPDHAHAVVLAARYTWLSASFTWFFVAFVVGTVFGVAPLVLAGAVWLAVGSSLLRGGEGRNAEVERRVHVVFGSLSVLTTVGPLLAVAYLVATRIAFGMGVYLDMLDYSWVLNLLFLFSFMAGVLQAFAQFVFSAPIILGRGLFSWQGNPATVRPPTPRKGTANHIFQGRTVRD